MRRTCLLIASLLISTGLWAMHCPQDMARIDAMLAENPPVSAEQLAEVRRLRAEGELLHKSGQHAESVQVLKQALDLLQTAD